MQMFCCSMIKDQKLYFCPVSKKGFNIHLASFSFTCEHIYQLTFYSYPWVLTFVTLNFKQRSVSEKDCAVGPDRLTHPRITFLWDCVCRRPKYWIKSSNCRPECLLKKIASGFPAWGDPSLHIPVKGLEVFPLSQICQTQSQAGNQALLTSFWCSNQRGRSMSQKISFIHTAFELLWKQS